MPKKDKNPARFIKGAKGGFPRGRLIWSRLFEAEAMEEGNDPSYSCAVLYRGGKGIEKIRSAIKAAKADQWPSGKAPRRLNICLIEDDEIDELAETYDYIQPGDVILKMRRLEKYGPVQKFDQNVDEIESPSELYSGCHVVCDVEFFGWERKTSAGISCRVNGVQKVRDDEQLGGGATDTTDSFDAVNTDDEDDDDDDRQPRKKKHVKPSRRNDDDDDDNEDDEDDAPPRRSIRAKSRRRHDEDDDV